MITLLNKISEAGIILDVVEGQLKLYTDNESLPEDLIQLIRENKQDLIDYLSDNQQGEEEKMLQESIPVLPTADGYLLSSAQRRLWVLSQFDEASAAYNLPSTIRLAGEYNFNFLTKAIEAIIDRHEILRTVFKRNNSGEIKQYVIASNSFEFSPSFIDLSNESNPNDILKATVEEDFNKFFDLENGPLFRVILFQLPQETVIYYNMHHIISDGWSMNVLNKDMMECYQAIALGSEPNLAPLNIQYKDFAAWQLSQLQLDSYQQHSDYWKELLSGELPVLNLPSNLKRPLLKTHNGRTLETYISKSDTARLKSYCQANGGSLFMGLMTSLNVLFNKYTGETDFILGTPVAGREHNDLVDQIGCYINVLALRNNLNFENDFDQLFNHVKQATLTAFEHQYYPFDQLVEELRLKRDTGRNPVFDAMVVLQNMTENESAMELSAEQVENIRDLGTGLDKFDLNFVFEEVGDYIRFIVKFNTDVYEKELITQFIGHFKSIIKNALDTPEVSIAKLDYLLSPEREQLVFGFNDTKHNYSSEKTLVDLLEDRVKKSPDSVAVIDHEKSLDYKGLNAFANQIGVELLKHGVKPGDYIGLHMSRSTELIAATIGILKSGAVYVPFEPSVPQNRKTKILDDLSTPVIITDVEHLEETLKTVDGLNGLRKIICLGDTSENENYPENIISSAQVKENTNVNLNVPIDSMDEAYIIFTSGSTGVPKGVVVEHKPVINLVEWVNDTYQVSAADKLLMVASISFDLSVYDIFGTIHAGGTLRVASHEEIKNIDKLVDIIYDEEITFWDSAPGALSQIMPTILEQSIAGRVGNLRLVFMSGDWIPLPIADELKSCFNNIEVIGLGGATEAVIWSNHYPIGEIDANWLSIPYGKPIWNACYYVLDTNLNPCPIGVEGDLYIGGKVLAKEYKNAVELTASKFIPSPFIEGGRIYKTGDRARFYGDGNLEFRGRQDHQVKIRGYRIELGEIEHNLLKIAGIEDAVVLTKGERAGKELVAFLVMSDNQNIVGLRNELQKNMPDYMLPAQYIQLEKIPVTVNGKVDKKALKQIKGIELASGVEYAAPNTELEITLAEIWIQLLERDQIGLKDDFFELGGDSLKAMRLISEYHKSFNVRLALKDLFAQTVLEEHVNLIEGGTKSKFETIDKAVEADYYAVSSSQKRLWLIDQLDPGTTAYNMFGTYSLPSNFALEHFEKAVNQLIARHEILRTVFIEEDGVPYQKVLNSDEVYLNILTGSESDYPAASIAHYRFDLSKWSLLKMVVVRGEEKSPRLLFCMHHIISDGWSMELFIRDLLALYESMVEDTVVSLPALSIQYKDYAVWQNKQLSNGYLSSSQTYWQNQLGGRLPQLRLPEDYATSRPSLDGSSYELFIGQELKNRIEAFIQGEKVSLFSLLMSSFKVMLHRLTAEEDLIVGTPVANRSHESVKDLIGFFLNTLMIRNKVDSTDDFRSFLQQVNQTLITGLEYQSYPFENLLDDLDVVRDYNRFPISSVFLNMIDFNSTEKVTINELAPKHEQSSTAAKFDMECYFKSYSNAISIYCIYKKDLFKADTIAYWMNNFLSVVDQVVTNPDLALKSIAQFDSPLNKLDYPKPAQTHTFFAKEKETTLVARFEKQAEQYANNPAIVSSTKTLTYQELNAYGNGVAHLIQEQEQSSAPIALLAEHGWLTVGSMLGALKSGHSYLPLDPSFPEDRLKYMLEDTNSKLLLATPATLELANQLKDDTVQIIVLDESVQPKEENPVNELTGESPAYILYTSGSTGKPKGVVQNHKNVLHFISVYTNGLHLTPEDRLSLLPTYGFDAAVMDIYGGLLNGSALYPYHVKTEGLKGLNSWLEEEQITVLHMVPTLYRYFLEDRASNEQLKDIRLVVLGGEAVYQSDFELFKTHFTPGCIFINGYGPTESTITLQNYMNHSSEVDNQKINIGYPVADTTVYVLDDNDKPLGIYQEGELVYKSNHLAVGYHNKADQTAIAFTDDPVTREGRVYRSGDLGRLLPSGEVEFTGRKDSQVKLNGQRIELSEIEQALLKINAVEEAIVLMKSDGEVDRLVSYIKTETKEAELRQALSLALPMYMVPTIYVYLDVFPLTPTGKISRRDLPEPDFTEIVTAEYVAPRNEVEQQLVDIWQEVLNKDQIGVHDNFFDLGGHSLKAVRLSNEYWKKFSIRLSLRDIFLDTSISSHVKLIEQSTKESFAEINTVDLAENYPISDAQKRMWILNQFEENSAVYNMHGSIYLNHEINLENLNKALIATLKRHEILRTVFKVDENEEIRQWIQDLDTLDFKVDYQDYREDSKRNEKVSTYISEDSYTPFDLTKGPLLRTALLHVEDDSYVFYYNMHHIVSDGWSMNVLAKDVFAFYQAFEDGGMAKMPALRIQYKDYSTWQLAQLESSSYESDRSYWLSQLSGETLPLDLPEAKKRPLIKTHNGRAVQTYLDSEITEKIKNYSEAQGGSLFIGLLGAWNVLMYRYTGQDDLVIGTPIAGRNHPDLENQIGFYVNTLALRNQILSGDSFDSFHERLKENTLNSYSHQMYPFDRLVDELNLVRDTSRSALFDMFFILQNNGDKTENVIAEENAFNEIKDLGSQVSKFDVSIAFEEVGDFLSLKITFNSDIYTQSNIERVIVHYKNLLNELLKAPSQEIAKIEFLTKAEREQLLSPALLLNESVKRNTSIIDAFEAQVLKTPNETAVVFENESLTYRELNNYANQLAHYLSKQYDIESNDLIGIQLGRSEWLLISILGVLKSGGAYVPIDPEYPQERIDYIINDASCKAYLNAEELQKFKLEIANYSEDKLKIDITETDLAYAIYTSGSTGKPKGVLVENKSLVNYIISQSGYYNVSGEDRFVLFSNYSFDASIEQLFLPLTNGARLFIPSRDTLLNPARFMSYCGLNKITHLHAVPSFLSGLDWSGNFTFKRVVSAGDSFNLNVWKDLNGKVELYNKYGPTETTISSLIYNLSNSNKYERQVPIGKPINETHVLILNEDNMLQPTGVVGEICTGGLGIARGYLNQVELTNEKFIAHPFKEGERLFKTGDLGKLLPDGNIEFVGRKDDQVKIRGYRIDLGEIEHVLLSHDKVDQVTVIVRSNEYDEKELVAFFVSEEEQNSNDLRDYLGKYLQEYMLPGYFVQLDELPLTSNGKVDKKALPNHKGIALASGVEYIAPRTEIEEELVNIWETVLQREAIGIKDDFFTLGGHSLKAIRLSSEYQKRFSVKLSLKDLFLNTDIESHAILIEKSAHTRFNSIEPIAAAESYAISDAQRRLWVLSQFEQGKSAYNMPFSLPLHGIQSLDNFKKAIGAAVNRHEILRTVFKEDANGEVRQWVLSAADFNYEIKEVDLREESNLNGKIEAYVQDDLYRSFDLENGPLFRMLFLQTGAEDYVFYYNMHHIISDGWSMNVLRDDVLTYYKAFEQGVEASLPVLPIQYKDYAAWQLAALENGTYESHKTYWLSQLSGELPVLDLPSNQTRPIVKTYEGHNLSINLPIDLTQNLKDFSQENGGSLFMGILTTWNILLSRYSGQKDLVLGTPVAGRDHADLNKQIGFYVNTLALRNHVNPEEGFKSCFNRIKETTLTAYEHQHYPFDRLVDELNLKRDTTRNPLFDIMLTLQNVSENEIEVNSSDSFGQVIDNGASVAKFDMNITAQEAGDHLSIYINFNSAVYEKELISQLMVDYKILVGNLLANPSEKIGQVQLLSDSAVEYQLLTLNQTVQDYPSDQSVVDLFIAQSKASPNKVALVFEDQEWTYADLNTVSGQLANCLQKEHGIGKGAAIGIELERSDWQIISILGVLKAGAMYVPIASDYPTARKKHIVDSSNLDLLITVTDKMFDVDYYEGGLFAIDVEFTAENYEASYHVDLDANAPIYTMYTSGSTGKPKGVVVSHQNVVSLVQNTNFLDFNSDLTLLSTGAFSFDATTFEFWGMLLNGGRLVMCPQEVLLSAEKLEKTITEKGVNVMWFTSGWLNELVDSSLSLFGNLAIVVAGGDRLSPSHINQLRSTYPTLRIINGYGPTENTTFSLTHEIKSEFKGSVPIGKPLANKTVYILDEYQNLVPEGVVGELYLGGAGVALSYANDQEQTNASFIPNPFNADERLYRSGDLGKWLPDGTVAFMGRKDVQVKIRGYRITLEEIEQELSEHEEIENVEVLVQGETSGEKTLVAYFTGSSDLVSTTLTSYLKTRLPSYMHPSAYVHMDAFPLTKNGKVDRKALAKTESESLKGASAYVAPETATEKTVVSIWEAVLEREKIGVADDFFELGGHSLKAMRLVNEYHKELGIRLSLKDLFVSTVLSAHVALLDTTSSTGFDSIEPIAAAESYAISDAQRRLWVLSQFEQGKSAYNMPFSLPLHGVKNLDHFKKAIGAAVNRHEILRTVFKEDANGEVRQWVLSAADFNYEIKEVDLREESNLNGKIEAYVQDDLYRSFDLENGPLFRMLFLQTGAEDYVFYYNMHHIISDGWSMNVLRDDVLTYYKAFEQGVEASLPVLPIQYKDYAAWQLAALENGTYESHKTYWLSQLSGELPVLDLPSNQTRPIVKTYEGHNLSINLPIDLTQNLKDFSQENGGSLFMGILTTWNILLSRYSGQKDLVLGTPVAGRDHADLNKQIGFYVNTLALRNHVNPEEGFKSCFNRIKETTLTAYEHQHYPFDRLVEELDLKRDTSRNPLFDIMLTLQNVMEGETQVLDEVGQVIDNGASVAKFDMNITAQETGDHLSIYINFNSAVYEKELISQLMVDYKTLVSHLLANPSEKVGEVQLLSDSAVERQLVTLNQTAQDYPSDQSVVDLFIAQSKATPNKVALVFEDKEWTYADLNTVSGQLADCLQKEHGIGKGAAVGIELERSDWQIISILGVLKAGAMYVPIASDYPTARKQHIASSSALNFLITTSEKIVDYYEGSVFEVDTQFIAENYEASYHVDLDANAPIYTMYTSGSTGKPKGVVVSHQNVVSLVQNSNFLNFNSDLTLLSTGAFSFDATTFEFWGMLLNGGTLVMCPQEVLLSAEKLEKTITEKGVNVMWFTSGWLNELVDSSLSLFGNLAIVVAGGDRLSPSHINQLRSTYPTLRIINGYGPTENTTFSLTHEIKSEIKGSVPIGKPLANKTVYILDEYQNLVPEGVVGELYLGGAGVALGYANDQEQTNASFIPSPFNADERLYRSGDLGKWLPDGTVAFMGRKDVQVKIRGYRITLEEIEQELSEHAEIENVVVLVQGETSGEKALVAYFTGSSDLVSTTLTSYLKTRLPSYMHPSAYVHMDTFPLTKNGKVDRKALAKTENESLKGASAYVAPETATEKTVVAIWEAVLEREKIGVADDFFELGGHSLKAMRLVNEYHKELGIRLSLKDLFVSTVLSAHVALLDTTSSTGFNSIEPITVAESYAISDAQRRLWVLSQFEQGKSAYNMPFSLPLYGVKNLDHFKKAIAAAVNRHEILRTVFKEDANGEVRQWVLSAADFNYEIKEVDLREESNLNGKIEAYVQDDLYRSFDLENGPLFRMLFLQTGAEDYVFYYNMHHIISDGWSMNVLRDDVLTYYKAFEQGVEASLPVLPIQYKDYAAWQLAALENGTYESHKTYWLSQLSGELPVLDLPSNQTRPIVKTYEGHNLSINLPIDLTQKLKDFSQENGGSLFMGILTTWNILLSRYSGQKDLVLGTPVAGRDHADLNKQIGFYVNTLALRNHVNPEEGFKSCFNRIKETTLTAYEHQHYPFDRLVEELDLKRDTSRNPLFDIMLTLQNVMEGESQIFDEVGKVIDNGASVAKFDMNITAFEIGNNLKLNVNFNRNVYETEMVSELLENYQNLLTELLLNPVDQIGKVTFLSKKAVKEQIIDFNEVPEVHLEPKTILDLLQSQAEKSPQSIAIEIGNQEFTYAHIEEESNRLANYLIEKYVIQKEDLIGIKLDRTQWTIISILAVLKTGGAYVPIDINYPQDRIDFIEQDAQLKLNIDQAELDTYLEVASNYESVVPQVSISQDQLAYIIYTSGSTGKPKGVQIEHKNASAMIQWAHKEFEHTEFETLLFVTSICFDLSVFEMFYPLTTGKKVCILENGPAIQTVIADKSNLLINTVPSVVGYLLSENVSWNNVSALNMAGEVIPETYIEQLSDQVTEIRNLYGPSEDTTYSTVFKISDKCNNQIGQPLSNTQVYILDEQQNLLPKGATGEICLSGVGLSRGYLNQPALTQEKFIKNPFSRNERLYRTGDMGKWSSAGTLIYAGRRDDQVKIRGYRIEVGEIERVLAYYPNVDLSVITVAGELEDKQLIAYLKSDDKIEEGKVKEFMMERLPEYMVPNHIIQLDSFPITENGKIDKKSLPTLDELGVSSGRGVYVAPRTETEEELVKIWEEILKKETVGVQDNFFDLGGHSLKAIKLLAKINKAFGTKVTINSVFNRRTIEELANQIDLMKKQEEMRAKKENLNEIEI